MKKHKKILKKIKPEDIIKTLMLKHKGKSKFNLKWNTETKEWEIR